jgi:hypothetical protein
MNYRLKKLKIQNENGLSTENFIYNERMLNGLYLCIDQQKVKSNIRRFDISVHNAIDDRRPGFRCTKIFDNVILTINAISKEFTGNVQYLITNKLTESDVLQSKSEGIIAINQVLIECIKLASVKKMGDLSKLDFLE